MVPSDEHRRPDITLQFLSRLKFIFAEIVSVTTGNSLRINDGIAALFLRREDDANGRGIVAHIRLVRWASAALTSNTKGYSPIIAFRRVPDRTTLTVDDLDAVELNETSAAWVLIAQQCTGLDSDRMNPNGGAIAMGHPVGATGARLCVKFVCERRAGALRRDPVTNCIGTGQSFAVALSHVKKNGRDRRSAWQLTSR